MTRVSREPDDDQRRHVGQARVGLAERRDVDAARPARPTARPNTTGVAPADGAATAQRRRRAARGAPARRDCRARSRNRALAAASSRRSISAQGLRLSDSEIAQKSWPSGAPMRAATASIAVMPGTTLESSARQLGGPASIASHTAAAMAKTPGSPPDTTATFAPCAAWRSAGAARAPSSRLSEAWRRLTRARRHAIEIGPVADRAPAPPRALAPPPACSQPRVPGPETDDRKIRAAHGRSLPAGHEHDGEIGRHVVASWRRAAPSWRPPWCRARHRCARSSRPLSIERAAQLRQIAADLHDHRGVGIAEAARRARPPAACRAAP